MLDFDESSVDAPDWYEAFEVALGIENYDEALRLAKDAVHFCKEDFDEAGEAVAHCQVARACLAKGDTKGAKRACDQANKVAKEAADAKAEAAALHALAKLGEPGSPGKAEEALEAYRSLGDKAGEGSVLITMARVHHGRGDHDLAIETAREAKKIFQDLDCPAGEAAAAYVHLLTVFSLGRTREASTIIEDMICLYQSAQDVANQSSVLMISAQLLLSQGRITQALDAADMVMKTAESLGDWRKKATAVYLMANAHLAESKGSLDSWQKATEYTEIAWQLFREVRDKSGQAAALSMLADFAVHNGDAEGAAHKYEEVAHLHRSLKDTLEEARALRKLANTQLKLCNESDGIVKISQGSIEDPVNNANRAVELFQQVGRAGEREVAQTMVTLAKVLAFMGEVDQALDTAKSAQQRAYELGDDSTEASAWLQQARLMLLMDLRSDAVEFAEKAVSLAEGVNQEVKDAAEKLIEQNSRKKTQKGPAAGNPKSDIQILYGKAFAFQFLQNEARIARHMTAEGAASSSGGATKQLVEAVVAPKPASILYNLKWSDSIQVHQGMFQY